MGNNYKWNIIGKGKIGNGTFILNDILYVENLHHNLI